MADSAADVKPLTRRKRMWRAFTQQRLPANKPILSPKVVIILFSVMAVFFLALGITMLVFALGTYETEFEPYGDDDECELNDTCEVEIKVDQDMDGPVYLYYKLEDFHQNHRRYVKSRNDKQLRGEELGYTELVDCQPYISKNDEEDDEKVFLPCGLVAKTYFDDKYTKIVGPDGKVDYDDPDDKIAWNSDVKKKFKNLDEDAEGVRVIKDFTDPHFVVWMRVSAFSTFRKLYAIIDDDLKKGTYKVTVKNKYDTGKYDATKSIGFANTNFFGTRNIFLPVAYMCVGGLCMIAAILATLAQCLRPRRLGDSAYLSFPDEPFEWNNNNNNSNNNDDGE